MALNSRKIAIAAVTAYLADFVFNWLYHGNFAMGAYKATASLWRTEAQMQDLMAFCILGHLILVSIAAVIFAKGYEKKGYMEGFRFGILLGLILASRTLVSYVHLPITADILNIWLAGDLLEGTVIGLTFAMVFGMNLDEKAAKAPKSAKKSKKK